MRFVFFFVFFFLIVEYYCFCLPGCRVGWILNVVEIIDNMVVEKYQILVPVSVLWVGLQKSTQLKLGCEKYFRKVTY
jgi:hypothetical protein